VRSKQVMLKIVAVISRRLSSLVRANEASRSF